MPVVRELVSACQGKVEMSCGLSGDVVDINLEIKAPEVNMFMPTGLYRKIRAAAGKRDVPLNVIVNSAMAQWLANAAWSTSVRSGNTT